MCVSDSSSKLHRVYSLFFLSEGTQQYWCLSVLVAELSNGLLSCNGSFVFTLLSIGVVCVQDYNRSMKI